MFQRLTFAAFTVILTACGTSTEPTLSDVRIGHCVYTGPQSRVNECKDYLGAWKVADAEKDCTDLKGTFTGGAICAPAQGEFLGACLFGSKPEQNRTYIVTNDTGRCSGARTGCEFFGGGFWKPSPLCGNVPDEVAVYENAWKQPQKKCFVPDSGVGAGTEICVWEAIHGATIEGRSFREDANCDNSRSGRPYYPKDPDARWMQPDPRRSDPAYLAEEAWVKSQINATSCVCCHANAAPNAAASIFNIDAEGSLANQFTDRGIAHGSGTVPSIPLGAFPPAENNGFVKSDWEHPDYSIFLTTDPARMKRFWQAEEAYRGLTAANFVGVPDGFGPLSEQLFYQPQACAAGEGVGADGTITWGKGKARYVYVMETTAKSPTVWPNLDLPADTLWRLDVPSTSAPLENRSVKYGVVPEGMTQKFPVAGAPAALTSGKQYYLYVTADVMLPFTRCLFTAP
jgi:hypothetical protein